MLCLALYTSYLILKTLFQCWVAFLILQRDYNLPNICMTSQGFKLRSFQLQVPFPLIRCWAEKGFWNIKFSTFLYFSFLIHLWNRNINPSFLYTSLIKNIFLSLKALWKKFAYHQGHSIIINNYSSEKVVFIWFNQIIVQ